jgi:hypothetical protein
LQNQLHSASDYRDDMSSELNCFGDAYELLVESIDESFAALLGSAAKDALLRYLLMRRALDVKEIPHRMDDFEGYLREVFGRAAEAIERNILERFHHRLGVKVAGKTGYALSDNIDEKRNGVRGV